MVEFDLQHLLQQHDADRASGSMTVGGVEVPEESDADIRAAVQAALAEIAAATRPGGDHEVPSILMQAALVADAETGLTPSPDLWDVAAPTASTPPPPPPPDRGTTGGADPARSRAECVPAAVDPAGIADLIDAGRGRLRRGRTDRHRGLGARSGRGAGGTADGWTAPADGLAQALTRAGPGPEPGSDQRRAAKNAFNIVDDSSASTPPTMSARWLSRGSSASSYRLRTAPALGSVAP